MHHDNDMLCASTLENYYKISIKSNKEALICPDDDDYNSFLSILGMSILKCKSVEVLAYNMSPDQFCLIVNQIENNGYEKLMHDFVVEYNKYYYKKYNVDSAISVDKFDIEKIQANDLLMTSCKMYLASDIWMESPYSSIRAYFYNDTPAWLTKSHIAGKYKRTIDYLKILNKYSTNVQ